MNSYMYSTGKRKSSIARVFLKDGTGIMSINKMNDYFIGSSRSVNIINKPLQILQVGKKFDIIITVKGGGITGQAEAIRHGLSKALIKYGIEKNDNSILSFKKTLKDLGFLTRDPRKVERKKVGRRKARKKEQYSKR